MRLGKLKIPVNIKTNLTTGEVTDNNYIALDVLTAEYNDISSIENWHTYGMMVLNDYLSVRKEIYNIFIDPAKLWVNCTNKERDIIIAYYVYKDNGDGAVDTEKVTHLLTTGQVADIPSASTFLINSWNNFNKKNINDLKSRWFYVKPIVLKYLTIADAENLFETVKGLVSDMFIIGRLGIGYGLGGDNENGLMNYVVSDEQFDGTGMEFDGYILKEGTWATFETEIQNVLENGIYDKSINNG
jgi:hypothetical protein